MSPLKDAKADATIKVVAGSREMVGLPQLFGKQNGKMFIWSIGHE